MINKVAFFTFSPTVSAIEHYRIFGPLTKAGVQVLSGIKEGRVDPSVIKNSDLVLFQRDFASHFEYYKDVIRLARELGKPAVMDLDDDLLALPSDHPDRISTYYASGLPAVLHALLNVDGVTVTTEPLKEAVQHLNPNVWVLPNYFDDQLWDFSPQKPNLPGEPITIFYMGTVTHRPDLDSISKPLFRLAESLGSGIEFYFYGIEPPSGLEDLTHVTHQNVQTFNYEKFSSYMSQIRADIAIAPLCDNTFNRSKSAIKFYEYTAMGIPGVYTDMPPYSNIINDGSEGLLAQTSDQWFEKIKKLIDDPNLRQRIVFQSRKMINENYLMSVHASEWSEIYSKIKVSSKDPQLNRNNLLGSLEQVVAQQIEIRANQDLVNELNGKTATQTWQIGVLEEQKTTADEEIIKLKSNLERKESELISTNNRLKLAEIVFEEKNKVIDVLEEKKAAAEGEINRLSYTLEETSQKLVFLEEQKTTADEEIIKLKSNLERKESELISANNRLKLVEIVFEEKNKIIEFGRQAQHELINKVVDLERILADNQHEIDKLESTISKLLISKSWKITRPLRKVLWSSKERLD